jgi:NitT/TauT family transport system substrate-binding protein
MRRIALSIFLILAFLAGCAPVTGTQVPAPATADGGTTDATASPVPSGTSKPLNKMTLAMGYIPSVQFAPFYVAQEKGYFRDAGLDVTFQYGAESDLVKLVGSNQVPFMIGSGDQVVLGRSQGLPVRYVMRWYRRFPVVLFAKQGVGINAPKDLVGKKVGISMLSGASYVAWKALVFATGLDPSKVNLQVVGFTQAAAVGQDRVDAALDYSANGPVQMGLAGTPITVMPVANYMDLPSNGIITNDEMIKDHPDAVQALVQATLRGLQDTLANPDAAFAASLRAVPEAGGDQAKVNRAIFDESLKLWQAEPGALGVSDPKMWEQAAAFMKQTGLIDQAVAPADLYTNQFLTSQ